MDALPLYDAGSCPVDRFLALEQWLLQRAESEPPHGPCLAIARLQGKAHLLGRFQRASSSLKAGTEPLPTHRRLSGGRTLAVGEGVLAVALVVPRMGDLLDGPIPPARFINRYVRGVLKGLTRAGAPNGAHYFGRDFISAESQQVAVVGQQNGPLAGLLEVFIAVTSALALPTQNHGYPEHADPRAGGPPHTTLMNLRTSSTTLDGVAKAVSVGIAELYGRELQPVAPLPELAPWSDVPPVLEEDAGWASSGLAEIPIGFVEALVQMDGEVLRAVRFRGDFIAPDFVIRGMEEGLVGLRPRLAEVGKVIDAAFHQPGAFILGVNELRLFADAVLEAADEFRT